MRRLAKDAELSVTTLYNLIGGRDEIVSALIDDAMDQMDAVLADQSPMDDPLERCHAVVTVSIRYVIAHEKVFRALALTPPDDLQDRIRKGARFGTRPDANGRKRAKSDEPDEAVKTSSVAELRIAARASEMQSRAIREAISQGLLIDLLDPDFLGAQIYHGWEAAFYQWGRGLLDEAGFLSHTLYGLYVALLGVASTELRPNLESKLRALELELRKERTHSND